MPRNENDWYLVRARLEFQERARRRGRRMTLWALPFVGVALLMVLQLGHSRAGLKGDDPGQEQRSTTPVLEKMALPVGAALVFVVVVLGVRFAWRRRMKSAFAEASQHPGPEKWIGLLTKSTRRAQLVPDMDAFGASAQAGAYAFYDNADGARRVLSQIDWGSRSPLVQASGLTAEAMVALLCAKNPARASDLHKRAQALSALGAKAGAPAARDAMFETVTHAFLSGETTLNSNYLEERVADSRQLSPQLFAAFGLAAWMERSGKLERTRELRAWISRRAPHCTPLHATLEEFSEEQSDPGPTYESPVVESLASIRNSTAQAESEEHKAKSLLRRQFLRRWVFPIVALGYFAWVWLTHGAHMH